MDGERVAQDIEGCTLRGSETRRESSSEGAWIHSLVTYCGRASKREREGEGEGERERESEVS